MSEKGKVENIEKDLKLNLGKLIFTCKDERIMSETDKIALEELEGNLIKNI